MNLLFLCSRNQWRSPTAEKIFARRPGVQARSRGLSDSAVRRLTSADIAWAEVVFVMESKHKRQLLERFRDKVADRPVHVLDIPDEYRFMDAELVELLTTGVEAVLDGVG